MASLMILQVNIKLFYIFFGLLLEYSPGCFVSVELSAEAQARNVSQEVQPKITSACASKRVPISCLCFYIHTLSIYPYVHKKLIRILFVAHIVFNI